MNSHSEQKNDLSTKILYKLPHERSSGSLQIPRKSFKRQINRFFRFSVFKILLGVTIVLTIMIYTSIVKYNVEVFREKSFFDSIVIDEESAQKLRDYKDLQFNIPQINAERIDWTDYAAMEAEKTRKGNGEQGSPTFNTDNSMRELENQMALENGFNAFVSNMISVNRSVPDKRPPKCRHKRYLAKLPTVSIVIPCRNEYYTVLQRTMHSIVNRTPKKLLKEIIIVDDDSFRGFTIDQMTEYSNLNFPNIVKFVRLPERKGLIFARVAGAKVATGDVLVFFDSHIECNYNWLQPLLEPIAIDYRISTSPIIDTIKHDTFAYDGGSGNGWRGGFDWNLKYTQMTLKLPSGADITKPYKDPVMMGGLFAISRKFFWELGGYDIGLDIWGAEQFELSFKIWMCGGMLLGVPCSHVAHIFRGPWENGPSPRKYNFIATNVKRVAEVWMDDYKKYIYENEPETYNTLDAGDLSSQHALRKRLQCKSFKWYLENVAPDILEEYPPVSPPDFANGTIRSVAYPTYCLDNLNHKREDVVGVYFCASNLTHPQQNQFWKLTFRQELQNPRNQICLDISKSPPNAQVYLWNCHHGGGNQFWYYDRETKLLIHGSKGNKCLEIIKNGAQYKIVANICSTKNLRMKWNFGFVNTAITPKKS